MMEKGGEWLERSRQSFQAGRYDAALREVAEALRLEPQMADAWNLQGAVLKQLGRSPEALNNYDRALTLDPRSVKAWFNKGLLLEELQRVQEAIACYQKVMELQPDFAGMGDRLNALQRQNLTASETAQTTIISQAGDGVENGTGDDAESWYERGNQQFMAGDFRGAIASYDKALEVRLDMHEAWSGRGASLNNLGEYEQALVAAEEAIKINFKSSHAWHVKGFALSSLEREEEAIACYDKALEFKPDDHYAWIGRGVMLSELGRNEEAIASYNQALEFKPNDHEAWIGRGIELSDLGRYEKAIASYDKALEFKPDDHLAWISRASAVCSLSKIKHFSPDFLSLIQTPDSSQHNDHPHITSLLQGQPHLKPDTEGWGEFHLALGDAYSRHARGHQNPHGYWRKANNAYQIALPIVANHSAKYHLKILQGLMRTFLALGHPEDANAYRETALRKFHDLLNAAPSSRKRQLEIQFSGLSQIAVDVLVQNNQPITALETADRNKNRALNWILEDWQEPTWSPRYPDLQRLLTCDRAALYWHLSPDTLTTFLIQANAPAPIVSTQPIQPLEDWLKAWNKDYQDYRTKGKESSQHRQTHPWRTNLKSRLTQLQTILQISTLEQQLEGITQLILLPHRQLHQLPLHSLFNQRFTTTYLPSLQVSLNLQQRVNEQDTQLTNQAQLLSVENPLNDLEFAEIESVVVQQMFQQTTILDADAATPQAVQNALKNCHGFHFTGHAAYSDRQPQNSALTLANQQPLTAQTIQGLNLQTCQLVCLSACETALTGNQTLETEYVGLVSAFLQAKAAAVVSTLWTVEEISNAWLIIYFYQLILVGQPIAVAMQQAQQWLQTVTYRQIINWLQHQIYPLVQSESPVAQQIKDVVQAIQQDPGKIESPLPPYQDPYYWAAFTFTGLFTDRQSA